MPRARRHVLLRVANVNPDSVNTHTDRVLYSAIGVFIVLYFVYATVGGAAFIDASSNYQHPWYRWLIGPLVAAGVVAYDRAVVGRVAISYEKLDSTDPQEFLRKPTIGLYLGRLGLAVLFAVIITEPLMLARYQGEIDSRLNEVHNQQLSRIDTTGVIATWTARLQQLKKETTADDAAVRDLTNRAAQKRHDARLLYQQAVADSEGAGVSRSAGCPRGGYCHELVQRSRGLDDQAEVLDRQAGRLLDTQRAARDARTAEQVQLAQQIGEQRQTNSEKVRADAGFGARTAAMWYLMTSDFWGVGIFYLGITLLLVALDCAAVGLKFVSRGNAYERNEARIARRREHEAALLHEREIHDARTYGAAMARVVAEGIEAAAHDEAVARESAARASAVLRTSVAVPEEVRKMAAHGGRHYRPLRNELLGPAADDAEQAARNGRHRRSLHPPVVINEDVRVLPGSPPGRHYNGE
ncbi:DUF4407 domain-containing protein [Paractinoplanes rishiriensis]|uniref:DUF4407 domain-containing protein n=1 Tax=Paractinoplanes rishiriensis TaxID=1050105 RepID=A0A919K4W6_9ACTN|nr:DUF4407 domain-containing protein [Actinoplanes rishiriensis]GIE99010.1 hypothetical protein Ari01nite_64750 [Actinoplanes rishiriensis]